MLYVTSILHYTDISNVVYILPLQVSVVVYYKTKHSELAIRKNYDWKYRKNIIRLY